MIRRIYAGDNCWLKHSLSGPGGGHPRTLAVSLHPSCSAPGAAPVLRGTPALWEHELGPGACSSWGSTRGCLLSVPSKSSSPLPALSQSAIPYLPSAHPRDILEESRGPHYKNLSLHAPSKNQAPQQAPWRGGGACPGPPRVPRPGPAFPGCPLPRAQAAHALSPALQTQRPSSGTGSPGAEVTPTRLRAARGRTLFPLSPYGSKASPPEASARGRPRPPAAARKEKRPPRAGPQRRRGGAASAGRAPAALSWQPAARAAPARRGGSSGRAPAGPPPGSHACPLHPRSSSPGAPGRDTTGKTEELSPPPRCCCKRPACPSARHPSICRYLEITFAKVL